MKPNSRRRLISIMEAFISPMAGIILQLILYFFMGIEVKDVSLAFILIFWLIASAATAMVFERIEVKEAGQ